MPLVSLFHCSKALIRSNRRVSLSVLLLVGSGSGSFLPKGLNASESATQARVSYLTIYLVFYGTRRAVAASVLCGVSYRCSVQC